MPYSDAESQKRYLRQHYLDHQEDYKKRARVQGQKQRLERRQWRLNYLKTRPCIDCGESDPVVLQFDHVRDKITEVSELLRRKVPMKLVEEEAAKCVIRCANCHLRKTAKQFGWG